MHNYPTRGITDEVDAEVRILLGVTAGPGSARATWQRALINIGVLDVERNIPANEVWQRALQIARVRRGEQDLQPPESLKGRLFEEIALFDQLPPEDVQGRLYRLCSVLYYAVQLYAQDGELRAFNTICELYCQRLGLSQPLALRCAAAKFSDRAPRSTPDHASELRAIQTVLDQFQNSEQKLDNDIIQ